MSNLNFAKGSLHYPSVANSLNVYKSDRMIKDKGKKYSLDNVYVNHSYDGVFAHTWSCVYNPSLCSL